MQQGAVAPRCGHGPRQSRARHAAAAVVAAAALLALAWGGGRGTADFAATQTLWEGETTIKIAAGQKHVQEAWGRPLADFHYEPHKLRLGVSLAAGKHNISNGTLGASRPSADESRQAIADYFARQEAEDEGMARLKAHHDEAMAVVVAQRVKMSADEARKSLAVLPDYAAWLHMREQQEIAAGREQERHERKIKDQFLRYDVRLLFSVCRVGCCSPSAVCCSPFCVIGRNHH
jgi:hypothetical protein